MGYIHLTNILYSSYWICYIHITEYVHSILIESTHLTKYTQSTKYNDLIYLLNRLTTD